MTANSALFEEDLLLSEENARAASAAALRKIHSFGMSKPRGDVFTAITTLTELSSRAESSLKALADALAEEDRETAALELARANALMDRLTLQATIDDTAEEPSYLRRRQSEK